METAIVVNVNYVYVMAKRQFRLFGRLLATCTSIYLRDTRRY